MTRTRRPVVARWFTDDSVPEAEFRLLGTRCTACTSVFFPREDDWCRNPGCPGGGELAEVPLSPRGRVWSYTDGRYRPPAPYVSDPDAPWEPYTLVAVELAAEAMVVLGQAAPGVRPSRSRGGHGGRGGAGGPQRRRRARLDHLELAARRAAGTGGTVVNDIAVLGAGMHPWGKWGRSFVSYGTAAARAALADAGLGWEDVGSIVGADTMRCGYPGYVAGATFAQALGWQGARVTSVYAACASGAQAIGTARAQILAGLADVVLVVGADATPKGFLAPVEAASGRTIRTGCGSGCSERPTPRTSRSTPAAGWPCTATRPRTSPR